MKLCDLSTEKAAQAVVLCEEGLTQRSIANRLGVNQSTIQRCLRRHKETGLFTNRRNACGRKRLTSKRTDHLIRRIAVANPTCSSSFIATQLPKEDQLSARTIRHRLQHDFKLKAYRPAGKPKLSPKNIRDRLAFCRRYKNWTVDQWKQVLFSDETAVRQFANYTFHVRRPPGERFNRRYTIPKVKQSPTTMIWGCIAASGRGGLWIMPPNSTIKSSTYLDILKEKLPTWMALRNCRILQQDNAPVHSAKCVKEWLREEGYTLLEKWPGSSPDLNPIENCWVVLKKKVAKLNPTSQNDLRSKIKIVWSHYIKQEYCESLVESMPSRIKAVLKAGGGHSKY